MVYCDYGIVDTEYGFRAVEGGVSPARVQDAMKTKRKLLKAKKVMLSNIFEELGIFGCLLSPGLRTTPAQ